MATNENMNNDNIEVESVVANTEEVVSEQVEQYDDAAIAARYAAAREAEKKADYAEVDVAQPFSVGRHEKRSYQCRERRNGQHDLFLYERDDAANAQTAAHLFGARRIAVVFD